MPEPIAELLVDCIVTRRGSRLVAKPVGGGEEQSLEALLMIAFGDLGRFRISVERMPAITRREARIAREIADNAASVELRGDDGAGEVIDTATGDAAVAGSSRVRRTKAVRRRRA